MSFQRQSLSLLLGLLLCGSTVGGCSSSPSRKTGDTGGSGDGGSSGSGGTGGVGTGGSSAGTGGAGTGGSVGSGGSGGDTGGSSGSLDSGVGGGSAGSGGQEDGSASGGSGGGGGGTSGGGHDALLITGGAPIDASLLMGLKAKGFTVMMVADTTPATMAVGKALVVISPGSSRGNIDAKFKDSAVPIVVAKDGVMKALGMTGTDVVTATGLNKITMLAGADPLLSAGKTGDVTVFSNTDRLFAGEMLGPDAKKVATLVGQAAQFAIFAYDKGGMMPGGPAPARRVGFFAHQAGTLSPDGLALFEAAIAWATQ